MRNREKEFTNRKIEIRKVQTKKMDSFSDLISTYSKHPVFSKLKFYVIGKLYGFTLRHQWKNVDDTRQKHIGKAESLLWERHFPQDQRIYGQYEVLYQRCKDDPLASAYLWPLFIRVTERISTYAR